MSWRASIKALVLQVTQLCGKRPEEHQHYHSGVASIVWQMVVLLYLRAHQEVDLVFGKLPSQGGLPNKPSGGVHGVFTISDGKSVEDDTPATTDNSSSSTSTSHKPKLQAYHCCYRNPDIKGSQLDLRSCKAFIQTAKSADKAIIFAMHELSPREPQVVPSDITVMYASDYNAALMSAVVQGLSAQLLTTKHWSLPLLQQTLYRMRREQHTISFTEQDGAFTEPQYIKHSQLKSVVTTSVISAHTP